MQLARHCFTSVAEVSDPGSKTETISGKSIVKQGISLSKYKSSSAVRREESSNKNYSLFKSVSFLFSVFYSKDLSNFSFFFSKFLQVVHPFLLCFDWLFELFLFCDWLFRIVRLHTQTVRI